jgi:RimJ/RimL family protein N-acetyltransferase
MAEQGSFSRFSAEYPAIAAPGAGISLERPMHSHLAPIHSLVQRENSRSPGCPGFESCSDATEWLTRVSHEETAGAAITRCVVRTGYSAIGVVRLAGLDLPFLPPISYWIGAPFRRRGYGTAAVRLFLQQVEHPGRICAFAAEGNLGSRTILVNTGFSRSGVARHDANGAILRYDFGVHTGV